MEASDNTDNSDDTKHHGEKQTKQKKFQTQVRQLVETIDDMGNPFEEDSRINWKSSVRICDC